jgi:hypothetical protein
MRKKTAKFRFLGAIFSSAYGIKRSYPALKKMRTKRNIPPRNSRSITHLRSIAPQAIPTPNHQVERFTASRPIKLNG